MPAKSKYSAFIAFMIIPVLVLISLALLISKGWRSGHEYELATVSAYSQLEKFAEKHPEFKENVKNFVSEGDSNDIESYHVDYYIKGEKFISCNKLKNRQNTKHQIVFCVTRLTWF